MIFIHSNPMEESQMDEASSVEFKHVHRIMKWTHFPLLMVAVIALKSWLPARIPTVFGAAECLVGFFVCLFNHHVVFLVGNAIIALLFISTFHRNDESRDDMNGGFDDYWEHSQKLHALSPSPGAADAEEKRVVFRSSGNQMILKCDDLTAAMEEAKKQIDKFRREMAVRRQRPEAEMVADIENLSSEEFRRMVDAFIGKHWSNKKCKYGFQC